jgi:hypothetical protein
VKALIGFWSQQEKKQPSSIPWQLISDLMWSIRSNCGVLKECKTMKNDFLSGQNEEPGKANWETERL